jgi:hypothetical protein
MKRSIALLTSSFGLALVLLAAPGCERTTVETSGGGKLTLKKPADQTLTRGTTNDVRVDIDRNNIAGPVEVEVDRLPKGVHVATDDTSIPQDKESVTLTLHADPNADLVTNHRVTVKAKARPGVEATEVFQVTVKE